MKKIGIRFSDNDFGTTFRGILDIIKNIGIEQYSRYLTKSQFVDLINKFSAGIYYLCQNRNRYDNSLDLNYLLIDGKHLFIDEEVDNYIKELEDGWDNGEFYVLDCSNPAPKFHYVYSI